VSPVNRWASWLSLATSAQVIDRDLILTLRDQESWFSWGSVVFKAKWLSLPTVKGVFGRAYCQSGGFGAGHVSWGNRIRVFGGRCKPRPGDHETSQALDSRPRVDEDAVRRPSGDAGSG
jgi:hypothetical protein